MGMLLLGSAPAGRGWNTSPLGAGGLVTGMFIATDGAMVCRTDVGNIYRWSGTSSVSSVLDPSKLWVPLLTHASLAGQGSGGGTPTIVEQTFVGGFEHVLAPSNSAVHVAIFMDMTGVYKQWIWYSTNSGGTWNKSNVSFPSSSADSNGTYKEGNHKIVVDPANPDVAYCGMPTLSLAATSSWTTGTANISIPYTPTWLVAGLSVYDNTNGFFIGTVLSATGTTLTLTANAAHASSGSSDTLHFSVNDAGVYTTLNQAGGSSLATWSTVKTSGSTPIPKNLKALSCGLAIDGSSGTTTVGGQTVTNRIILPVGGVGIYESTDGGVTFSEIAASAFGTTDFYVGSGGFNAEGVYYCIVISPTAYGLWRYRSGDATPWRNITPTAYNSSAFFSITTNLIIDPRNNPTSKGYLSIFGPSGISYGYTAPDANTAFPPTWSGGNGNMDFVAPSFDLSYLEYLFGQGTEFCYGLKAIIDANGTTFWCGNQSIWYFGTSASNSSALAAPPNYGSVTNFYSYSFGRGQESSVAVDMICPPGAIYPILGPQDLGAPMRGTYTTFPRDVAVHDKEYTVGSLEWAASDPSFIVSCTTGQQNSGNVTAYRYSTNYGADGSWIAPTGSPDSLWSGGIYQGQLVAVDHDNWLAVPSGFNGLFVPAYTSDRGANWALTDLPSKRWTLRSWANGATSKPFAVGYGSDLNTVWACLVEQGSTSALLYRSADKGATFGASVGTIPSISASTTGVYCLSVPGFPDELWITATYTGTTNTKLWHVTNARTGSPPTFTSISLPVAAPAPFALTLGAPSSPGGYPTLYLLAYNGFNTKKFLYKGTVSGSPNSAAATVSWELYGPTGTQADLPPVNQLYGLVAIRGDWNVFGRIYGATPGTGFAYYNP